MKSQIDGSEATPWELIRLGEVSDGLERLASAYATDPSVSNTLSFGIGHLWIGHYGAAWNHFQDAIQRGPWTHDIYYGMAGTAKWCLNDYQAAVECWLSGLDPDYGDAAGAAVGNRLLLFAAAALRPHAISKSEAISLLQEEASDARLDSWPGPLVRLCLGESEVDFHLKERNMRFIVVKC